MLIYCRDEAEMEYLKIAQELEMYGISYFEIKVSYRRDGYQVADAFWSYKGLSVILTLLLPCFSVQIKHKISKNMNSVQQQCEHHHYKVLIESFHLSGHTFMFRWTVQDLEVFLV